MKRVVAFGMTIVFLLVLLSACDKQKIPAKAPSLNVALFVAGDLKIEDIQAAQLTTSWTDAKGGGYEADSFHPLQLRDYSEITFDFTHSELEDSVYELEIQFGDKYPPQSISVQRWSAVHLGTDSTAMVSLGLKLWYRNQRISCCGIASYNPAALPTIGQSPASALGI